MGYVLAADRAPRAVSQRWRKSGCSAEIPSLCPSKSACSVSTKRGRFIQLPSCKHRFDEILDMRETLLGGELKHLSDLSAITTQPAEFSMSSLSFSTSPDRTGLGVAASASF
jgi:hypothetical protein